MSPKLAVLALVGVLCLSLVSADEHHRILLKSQKQATDDAFAAEEEQSSEFWNNAAQEALKLKLAEADTTDKLAKNVIFFIGDGMSVQTVTAARIYTGGDENFQFAFDKMPTSGFSKTYCVDAQTPDSACTATAYHTGVKTVAGHLGMDARAEIYNCEDFTKKSFKTETISQWAMDAGMSVGLITTSRITDASPAPLFANSNTRHFETDQEHTAKGCDHRKLLDMAEQFVYNDLGKNLKVVLGGGRSVFLDKSITDEEGIPGRRADGKNLIEEWKTAHQKMGKSEYVWNRDQLLALETWNTDYVLGLFEGAEMHYNLQNVDKEEPSIAEMVEVAVKILSKNPNGFYLFVESGMIDYGHHFTMARVALDETKELGAALEKAQEMTNANDTLYVLTADHAHTMTINGYTERRSDILGLSMYDTLDGLPKTTLSYSTGPGYKNAFSENGAERVDLTNADLSDDFFEYPALVPAVYETHAADDVPIFANGPRHELFTGAYEQNALPYLMAYAAKIGPYEDKKERARKIARRP